ncbi:hypothetical protein BDV98DRAFT_433378 [Pterulicium gracile]|uniref:Uncharacterized protein n=1 Tax=Pterulicium gracile TaxID=1884261 RepID=A0A5C3QQK7_9AGAR|nr:hypothetical protein BDV98DRAFT_433378 [Pterula gracilis]
MIICRRKFAFTPFANLAWFFAFTTTFPPTTSSPSTLTPCISTCLTSRFHGFFVTLSSSSSSGTLNWWHALPFVWLLFPTSTFFLVPSFRHGHRRHVFHQLSCYVMYVLRQAC